MQTQLIGFSGTPLFNVFGPLLVTPAQTSEAFALERELEVLQDHGASSRWLCAMPDHPHIGWRKARSS